MADWQSVADNVPAAAAPPPAAAGWQSVADHTATPQSNLQRFAQSWWDNSVLKHPIDSAVAMVKSLVTMPDYHQLSPAEMDAVDAQTEKALGDFAQMTRGKATPEYLGQTASSITNPAIVGAATMGLAKGLGAAVDVAPPAWAAVKAGAKAAAPDVAVGSLKVAAGSTAAAAASGLGLPYPVVYGVGGGAALEGGRQIAKGIGKGFTAARESLAGPAAAAAPVVADAAATAAAADAAQFDPLAKAMADKPFADLSLQQQQALRSAAARDAAQAAPPPATSAPAAGPAAADAAAPPADGWQSVADHAAAPPQWEPGPPGTPAPLAHWEPPDSVREVAKDRERVAQEAADAETAAQSAQRKIEDAADQHAAYLQSQAEQIIWANRARKADRFASYLRQNSQDPTPENLASAADAMNEHAPPSDETVPMIHDRMGYTAPGEEAPPAPDLEQRLRDSVAAAQAKKTAATPKPGDVVGINGKAHVVTRAHPDSSFDATPIEAR